MSKTILYLFICAALIGVLCLTPAGKAQAQVISFPAEMNKRFLPISINPGGTSRLIVTIFNPNVFPLTDAAWTDNLAGMQPGLSIASPANVTNTCGGTVTAAPGGTSFSLSGGTVPAQTGATPGSCTVEVDITSSTPGNLINTIPAGALTSSADGGTITNTTPASATLLVTSIMAPTVNKSFSPNTMLVGQTSRLEISIRNNDLATTLTGATLTDDLPANLALAAPVSATLTGCGGSASLTAVSGGTSITLNNASIAADSTCRINVNVTSGVTGEYVNSIPAGALGNQQGLSNAAPASAALNVQAVGLRKEFIPAEFQAGSVTTLTITLENPDGAPYTGVAITDTLPGTVLTVVPGSASTTCGGTVAATLPRIVSLTGGTIPGGTATNPGVCTITVQVTAPADAASTTYLNTIPAGELTTDQGVSNAAPATAEVDVYQAGTGMTGNKDFTPDTILAGENSRLRINISAPDDTDLTNFSITDPLPPNITVSNSSPASASPSCGPSAVLTAVTGGTSISLTNGFIPAGLNCQINVYVTGDLAGAYINIIPPGNISNDEDRTVARDLTDTLTVQALTDFSISKLFEPPSVGAGGISTLTITLQNSNDAPLVNASITDLLPGSPTNGLIVAPTPDASTTCAGGTVTAIPGSQTISMTGGTVPPQVQGVPGTCTVRVNVQGLGSSITRTNTIPTDNASATVGGTNTVLNPGQPATASLLIGDLSIEMVKGFNPLTVFGGAASTLTVELVNPNNTALSGIAFTDDMPDGMILANPPNLNTGNCGGSLSGAPGDGTFALSGASLPAAASCSLTLSVTMTVNGNLTNTIPAAAVTTLNGASNLDPARASLTNLPGASVSKFFSPNPVQPGDTTTLTITIQNTGNVALSGMGLSDSLPGTPPAGLEVAASPGIVNGCGGTVTANAGSQEIELAGGSLGQDSACSFSVNVIAGEPGSYMNTIPAGSLTNNEGATNQGDATDTLTVGVSAGGGGGGGGANDPAAGSTLLSGLFIPLTGFAPAMVTPLDAELRPVYADTSLRLEIPVLKVDTSIVGVEKTDSGWDVSWLGNQVGWLNGSAYPTWAGNSLLTAHVVNADGKRGIFFHLKALGVGEFVYVYQSGYRYTYQVVSNELVKPDAADVFRHEERSYLTLLTCDSYDEASGAYLRRVAVRAKLVDVRRE